MKALTLLAALLTCGAVNATSLVTNGTFDSTSGWTLTATGGCASISGGVLTSTCSDVPTLEQPISGLIPGEQYTLSFKYLFSPANAFVRGTVPSVGVELGATYDRKLTDEDVGAQTGLFLTFSENFVATSATETLTFFPTGGTAQHTWQLDEVQIVEAQQQPAPVNSPAPLALLLAGGLALASRRVLSARQ
jgi:hypothetical protein